MGVEPRPPRPSPAGGDYPFQCVPLRRHRDDENEREAVELTALADGSLAEDRRVELEDRVAASPVLAAQLAEQQRAVGIMRSAAAEVEAPPALRARVDAIRQPRRAPAARRPAFVAVAAGAVAVVAIGLAAALDGGPATERFQTALDPTELAPEARGQATLTKTDSGWRIELDATGLPRLDGGRFYQAWLRNAADLLVPVGTFNEGRNVTLWSGVSPVDFPTLTVTREPADGDQASSGERVLVGTVDSDG
jgi:Anti-sigma-K factor rskA